MSGKRKDHNDQLRLKGHERSASAYDSTTAGSGMQSPGTVSKDSSNFDSGLCLSSEEITSASYSSQISQDLDSCESIHSDSKSYSVLDSGVDIDISENLSSLNIHDFPVRDLNDLNAPHKHTEGSSSVSLTSKTRSSDSSTDTIINPLPLPIDIYYEQDEDGDTQLHIAIYCKFIEVVYCLITMVPDSRYLDIRNDAWQTPLHFAVLTGQPRIVRRLVCAGASVDILDMHGNTALHLAVDQLDYQSAAAILQPINKVETDAAQLKYVPSTRQANNSVAYINRHNYDGLACIHIAVMKRSIQLVQLLLWHGADINLREWKSGMTPLHLAVQLKDQKMLDFILSACVDVDMEATTYAGLTAFQLAAHQQSPLAPYLLEKGADNCPIDDSDEEDDDDVSDDEGVNGSYHHGGFANSNVNGAINVSA